jgi:hypothetical protein
MVKQGIHDKFFVLLAQLPGATKEALVWQYSNMLTTSLKEFHKAKPEEYKRMLADLEVQVSKASKYYFLNAEIKRLRSAILHRLQKHGINTADWRCVNEFMVQPRIAGKMLFEMTTEEMTALIPKLESILKKDLAARESENRLSDLN